MSQKEVKNKTQVESKMITLSMTDLGLSDAQRKVVAPEIFAIEIRKLLLNWRQGTVASKGRAQVSGSNKKPWKQKGTGRARCGDAKSPLWRGGGVIFGPQKRTRTLKTTKKMRHSVAGMLVWNALDKGTIVSFDWMLENDVPKTKVAFQALCDAGLQDTHVNLFLAPYDLVTAASFANIPSVRIVFFDAANSYDLADSSHWIVLKKDIENFKQMVAQWI